MEGVDITNCMQGENFVDLQVTENGFKLARTEIGQPLKQLSEFVNENYELIRSLRENEIIHKNFEKHLARIYDAMLDIRFKLLELQ